MKPRATIHDLNSLRQVIRELQEENNNLKKLLAENGISYEDAEINEDESVSDDYDEDQGSRIVPVIPTEDMAKKFFSYFWGRTDVYAKRGKNGGYFPQCASRWDNPNCPKAKNEKQFCDEDCEYKLWKKLDSSEPEDETLTRIWQSIKEIYYNHLPQNSFEMKDLMKWESVKESQAF